MVLEYADGGDLFALLTRAGGRLAEPAAVSLVLQPFLAVLAHLHANGLCHRCVAVQCGAVRCSAVCPAFAGLFARN